MKFAALILLIVLTGCREIRHDPNALQLRYFKDTRSTPPLCYTYFWEGSHQGGPALANVPCEAVENLLE